MGVNYAVVITSNAGLWAYDIGDTVRFVSLAPRVSDGAHQAFHQRFGEHVIAEEVEGAMAKAVADQGGQVVEFHVAPEVNPADGLPYHEWFVEFAEVPSDPEAFARVLDAERRCATRITETLITGSVLRTAVLNSAAAGRLP